MLDTIVEEVIGDLDADKIAIFVNLFSGSLAVQAIKLSAETGFMPALALGTNVFMAPSSIKALPKEYQRYGRAAILLAGMLMALPLGGSTFAELDANEEVLNHFSWVLLVSLLKMQGLSSVKEGIKTISSGIYNAGANVAGYVGSFFKRDRSKDTTKSCPCLNSMEMV